jgi:CheY-like chemotaxis protein
MALRVLLADESSTIKKVFQLALQDFAVEVRPVNVGVDVLQVARNFKPDIIFADVLLQKKSGYEVSAELKQNSEMNGIPVVLMWSGFMELDEDKFQASHANAQLEKPFDVTALRKLVADLVPRTQNQRLSQFLTFPKLPDFEEKQPGSEAAPEPPPALEAQGEEDFKQVPLPKMKGAQASGGEKYRLNLSPEELEPEHVPVKFKMPGEEDEAVETEEDQFSIREPARATPAPKAAAPEADSDEELELIDEPSIAAATSAQPTSDSPSTPALPGLSAAQLEKLIREQSTEVIESVVWKVVPDLAAQIIERELNRLLKEREF